MALTIKLFITVVGWVLHSGRGQRPAIEHKKIYNGVRQCTILAIIIFK